MSRSPERPIRNRERRSKITVREAEDPVSLPGWEHGAPTDCHDPFHPPN